jgi:hypothetical protein
VDETSWHVGWTNQEMMFDYLQWFRNRIHGTITLILNVYAAPRAKEVHPYEDTKLGINLIFFPAGQTDR